MRPTAWDLPAASWVTPACLLGWLPIALDSVPTVKVHGETLQRSPDEGVLAVAAVKGVPLAAPPAGKLRWAAL